MSRPTITIHNAQTGETIQREMTEDEQQALLEAGWEPPQDNTDE